MIVLDEQLLGRNLETEIAQWYQGGIVTEPDSTKTEKAATPQRPRSQTEVHISQGWEVFVWGILGSIFGIAPATIVLIPEVREFITSMTSVMPYVMPRWKIQLLLVIWACLTGWFFISRWSDSLHEQVSLLKVRLILNGELTPEEQVQHPVRVPWIPAWTGIFERALYCLLIGFDVPGGATFIGAWVVLKSAGGWQAWSKGTAYGRATFFAGLLGNAMSILFGVVAGLVIRSLTINK